MSSASFNPSEEINNLKEEIQALKIKNQELETNKIPALEAENKAALKAYRDAWGFWYNKSAYKVELDAVAAELSAAREKVSKHDELIESYHRAIIANALKPELKQAPDDRSVWKREWDSIAASPIRVGLPVLAWSSSALYCWLYFFTPIRHRYAPYTEQQYLRRQYIFRNAFKDDFKNCPAAAKKTFWLGAFFLAVKGWISPSQPPH